MDELPAVGDEVVVSLDLDFVENRSTIVTALHPPSLIEVRASPYLINIYYVRPVTVVDKLATLA